MVGLVSFDEWRQCNLDERCLHGMVWVSTQEHNSNATVCHVNHHGLVLFEILEGAPLFLCDIILSRWLGLLDTVAQACRVAELAFMGFPFFVLRNVMSAISVAQARRVAELAFMGFLFFLLRNVMGANSVAQACRAAELAFMGFLFLLLRNVMGAISVAQACRVTELAFMGFLLFLLRNVMGAILVTQACRGTQLALHDIFKQEIILMQRMDKSENV
ncbi:hypothetical protein P5673_031017 [Acropora cervicornis]|uniref:Uncharacterized protein n=1 Tax=Acropora cervicornis TaxID=6130 RepID=A0AAD9USY9_ACRCE|nr:hypothetical protein P5673_031017 [Acropora cervicornis]